MSVAKRKAPVRKEPQKSVCLSAEGRATYDKVKRAVEKQIGMELTHDQVMIALFKKVGV